MDDSPPDRLRVALILGELGRGGAEKQALLMAASLRDSRVDARLVSFDDGGAHAAAIAARGIPHHRVRGGANPASRFLALLAEMRRFRPHIVQSGLFYWNLHAAALGAATGALAIGAVRSDGARDVALYGRLGGWLARKPPLLIANSHAARANLATLGLGPEKVAVLPNAIDLAEFDAQAGPRREPPRPVAVAVGRLLGVKRFDVFLEALATARRVTPGLTGRIIGDGPERASLEARADALGLRPDGVAFLGARDDVPALLAGASMLVLCSATEGFPNVILEAMAARLPVITTPAGDAATVALDGETARVVPHDDASALAEAMAELALDPALRTRLGDAGRERVEMSYDLGGLADRLRAIYEGLARRRGRGDVLRLLGRPVGVGA